MIAGTAADGVLSKRNSYEKLFTSMKTDRSTFDAHWRELSDYIVPRRSRWFPGDRNAGDKRNQKIIDSTGRFSSRTLSSGLHAGLTSPARPWMRLTTPDPDLAEHGPVKEWLHTVTQRMLTMFIQSNLYNTLPIVYSDMGVFGTAAMCVVDDPRELFRTYAYPIGSYVLGLNQRNVVTTFAREYELSVRQIVEQFGLQADGRTVDWTNISNVVRAAWERGDYETPVEIVWMVRPNEQADASKLLAKYLPFSSVHWERNVGGNDRNDKLLRESGYRSFPILAPRWDVTGEDTYGTDCPGMTCLGDVKQLQVMQKKKGQAIEKLVDPPLQGPSALRTQKTSLVAGDITYVDVREGMQGLRPIHEMNGLRLNEMTQDIGETQYRVRRAFYEDLFLMLAQSDNARGAQPVTAREIDERHEEKLIALGPVLDRTSDELLDPLVDRVFDMMNRAGLLPEPPQALDGVDLKVEYISIMAQAQKLVSVVGQDRFMSTMIPMMEVFPEIRHKIVINQVVDDYADMYGIDPRIVRDNETAEQLVEADRVAAEKAQQAEQAKSMAAAVHSAGTTPMEGDTALTRMVASGAADAEL